VLSRGRELPNPNSDGETHFRIHQKVDESNKIALFYDAHLLAIQTNTVGYYLLQQYHHTSQTQQRSKPQVNDIRSGVTIIDLVGGLLFLYFVSKCCDPSNCRNRANMPPIILNRYQPSALTSGVTLSGGKRIILGWAVFDQNQRQVTPVQHINCS
jgi:hypothetical protein